MSASSSAHTTRTASGMISKTKDKRQKTKDKRQKTKDKRQSAYLAHLKGPVFGLVCFEWIPKGV